MHSHHHHGTAASSSGSVLKRFAFILSVLINGWLLGILLLQHILPPSHSYSALSPSSSSQLKLKNNIKQPQQSEFFKGGFQPAEDSSNFPDQRQHEVEAKKDKSSSSTSRDYTTTRKETNIAVGEEVNQHLEKKIKKGESIVPTSSAVGGGNPEHQHEGKEYQQKLLADYLKDDLHLAVITNQRRRFKCKKRKSQTEACQLRSVDVPAKDVLHIMNEKEHASQNGAKSPKSIREEQFFLEQEKKKRRLLFQKSEADEKKREHKNLNMSERELFLKETSPRFKLVGDGVLRDWNDGQILNEITSRLVGPQFHGDKTTQSAPKNIHSYESLYEKYLAIFKHAILPEREKKYQQLFKRYLREKEIAATDEKGKNGKLGSSLSSILQPEFCPVNKTELDKQDQHQKEFGGLHAVFEKVRLQNLQKRRNASSKSVAFDDHSTFEKLCLRNQAGLPLRILELGFSGGGSTGAASFRMYDTYFYAEEKRVWWQYVEQQRALKKKQAGEEGEKGRNSDGERSTTLSSESKIDDDDDEIEEEDAGGAGGDADDAIAHAYTADIIHGNSKSRKDGSMILLTAARRQTKNTSTSRKEGGNIEEDSDTNFYYSDSSLLLQKKIDFFTVDQAVFSPATALSAQENDYLRERTIEKMPYPDIASDPNKVCQRFGRPSRRRCLRSNEQQKSNNPDDDDRDCTADGKKEGNNKTYELDWIVDETVHTTPVQAKIFHQLFRHCLAPGGVYIIEEMQTSFYPPLGASPEAQRNGATVHAHLIGLLQVLMMEPASVLIRKSENGEKKGNRTLEQQQFLADIWETGRWVENIDCDREVCVIRKRFSPRNFGH